jgi:hypothetical protein
VFEVVFGKACWARPGLRRLLLCVRAATGEARAEKLGYGSC